MILSCEFKHEHFTLIVYKTVTDTDCGFRIIPSPTKDDITQKTDEGDGENKEEDSQENNDDGIVENGSKTDGVNGADDMDTQVKVTDISDTEVTKVKDMEVTDISPGDVLSERYATLLPMITDCNPIRLICFLFSNVIHY